MPLVNPYCSVDQVLQELRDDKNLSLNDQLEDCINQASRWIDDYKGRDYFQHDHTSAPLRFDKRDASKVIYDTLFFPYTPIIQIDSVTVAGTAWVEDTDYVLKDDHLISINGPFSNYLCHLTDRIQILGKFGYVQATSADVPTNLPAHINKACILAAAANSGHNQKESIGLQGKETFIDKNIPKTVFDLLGRRRTIL